MDVLNVFEGNVSTWSGTTYTTLFFSERRQNPRTKTSVNPVFQHLKLFILGEDSCQNEDRPKAYNRYSLVKNT